LLNYFHIHFPFNSSGTLDRQQFFAKQTADADALSAMTFFYVFTFNLNLEKFNNLSVGKKLSIDKVKRFGNNDKAWIKILKLHEFGI
jgi:hypothetical protein